MYVCNVNWYGKYSFAQNGHYNDHDQAVEAARMKLAES